MGSACANCGLSFSDIKNQVLLQSNIGDIEKWAEHIYEWVIQCEREIGTFNGLHKVSNYKIENIPPSHLTPLPNDVYQLVDVCFPNKNFYYTGSTSVFNTSCNCGCANANNCTCIKWYVNGCYIQTSGKVDSATISYLAVPMDDEGFPYVKETHLKAIVAYIKYMMLQARFDEGKISPFVYQTRYKEWIFKRNEARAKDELPSMGEMQVMANIFNAKLPIQGDRGYLSNDNNFVIVM